MCYHCYLRLSVLNGALKCRLPADYDRALSVIQASGRLAEFVARHQEGEVNYLTIADQHVMLTILFFLRSQYEKHLRLCAAREKKKIYCTAIIGKNKRFLS